MNDIPIPILELEMACTEAALETESRARGLWCAYERRIFKLGFIAGTRHGIAIAQKEIAGMGKAKETKA